MGLFLKNMFCALKIIISYLIMSCNPAYKALYFPAPHKRREPKMTPSRVFYVKYVHDLQNFMIFVLSTNSSVL